ncbi:hypothetical protein MKK65_10095 [Methylobacterium sp. J-001]|uniref:hypothetical protein n=1 Tax=unclassified Methylobacterium TaxID=2615210 RepID=UPI001FB960FB|nr:MULTISPECIES: hypothetical protein [unclassified Methylobacterium]MCJ2095907.1 hypothetical protein [Methylobacterium sp. J-072]MCJ2116914.1 hypothetical protein [Methylobacterium sp. J-001]
MHRSGSKFLLRDSNISAPLRWKRERFNPSASRHRLPETGQTAFGQTTPCRIADGRKSDRSAWRPMQPSDRVTAELESGLASKRPSDKASGGRSLIEGKAIQLVALHLLVQGMAETVAFITSGPCRG